MPYNIRTQEAREKPEAIRHNAYSGLYRPMYPNGIDLGPNSKVHATIVEMIMDRVRASRDVTESRRKSWRDIEKSLTSYIDLDAQEEAIKNEDSRKPVSIVIPMLYATLDTFLTYWVASYFRTPMFELEPVGPEDMLPCALAENLLQLHIEKGKIGLPIYTMWRDNFAYGIGLASPGWQVTRGFETVMDQETEIDIATGQEMPTGNFVKKSIESILYEGNKLEKIHPALAFLDPNVSVDDIQKGEFVGWITRDNYYNLLKLEANPENGFFNVKYLKDLDCRSHYYDWDPGENTKVSNRSGSADASLKPVDVIYMCINLIPEDIGLSDYDRPEKWIFGLAGEQIIIYAAQLEYDHDLYPIVACASETDGYSTCPVSKLENVYGMQEIVNWLPNSHIANVRKSLNDMFVVDPWLVNINDVYDPRPGKVIRLRRHAYGRGVDNAIKQFKTETVTAGHLPELGVFIELMQRITGASDVVQGVRRAGGERISATEAENDKNSALSRLAKSARIGSIQAMSDIATMFISNMKQFMTMPTFVKATGRWRDVYAQQYGQVTRIPVGPQDILGHYDAIPHDGSMPSAGNVQAWMRVYEMIASNDILLYRFDIGKIFKYVAQGLGAKAIDEFEIRTQVQQDEVVARRLEQGSVTTPEEFARATEKPREF